MLCNWVMILIVVYFCLCFYRKELKRRMKGYVGQGFEESERSFKSDAGSIVKLN